MKRLRFLLAVILASGTAYGQEGQQALDTWMRHPEIIQIRQLYQQVESAVEAGQYSSDEDRVSCRGEYIGATLFSDSVGVVRKYETTKTTDFRIAEARYYYNSAGVLRFSFQSLVERGGPYKELRTYYAESGQVLYNDSRLIEGPDEVVRPLPTVWQPQEHFESLCPYIEPRSDVRIRDIQARLFCEQTADFTQDVISDSVGIVLWNVIGGGGDAGCHSNSTLVLIVIEGPPGAYLGDVYIETFAQSVSTFGQEESAQPKTLYSGKTRVGIANDQGHYFVPVWLYDTGCSTVRVSAWIDGARESTEVIESIPFACGE